MAPVLVARALRLPIIAAMAALALSGCMRPSAPVAVVQAPPVAVVQPPLALDAMAYGQPYRPAPVVVDNTGGGAISALLRGMARPSRPYAPAPAVYAAAGPPMPAPVQAPMAAPMPVAAPMPAPMPMPMPAAYDAPYYLDAGDRLRVVVYGQEGLTNIYAIDASGSITLPLIGTIPARGRTPAQLAVDITASLRNGFIREPSVAVEIEAYRPFFILGEVAAPGLYPYVPNMTVESAVAIAGGFSPRARRDRVTLTHTDASGSARFVVPLGTPIGPGDTVMVGERWF
jgi:polysaccharide export outer membrane protein